MLNSIYGKALLLLRKNIFFLDSCDISVMIRNNKRRKSIIFIFYGIGNLSTKSISLYNKYVHAYWWCLYVRSAK